MQDVAPFTHPPDARSRAALDAVLALADQAEGILRVASGLLDAHRVVRLDGFEQQAGRLCASALDLPAEQGRQARLRLIRLVAEIDRLRARLETS